MSNYIEARNVICDIADELIVDGQLDFPDDTFDELLIHFTYGIEEIIFEEDGVEAVYFKVASNTAQYLYDFSKTDADTYGLSVRICEANILTVKPLALPLRLFAVEVLTRKFERPKTNGRPAKRNWSEKNALYALVKRAEIDFGLPLTRNDQSGRGNLSACDVVAESLTVCGRKTSYSALKNLFVHSDHANFRKQRKFFELLLKKTKNL